MMRMMTEWRGGTDARRCCAVLRAVRLLQLEIQNRCDDVVKQSSCILLSRTHIMVRSYACPTCIDVYRLRRTGLASFVCPRAPLCTKSTGVRHGPHVRTQPASARPAAAGGVSAGFRSGTLPTMRRLWPVDRALLRLLLCDRQAAVGAVGPNAVDSIMQPL